MEAAVFGAPHEIHLADLPRPQPKPGEALVRMRAAGVCAGDLYIYRGVNPYVSYPRVGGHEIAGTVAALGQDTAGPAIGSEVVIEPFIGCGHCYPCRIGKSNCCANLQIIGVHRDGGFAEYVTAPIDRLHPVPDGLMPFEASFAEPVAIAVQASRRGMVTAEDTVLILGAGPIGLALVEVVRARGARVYVTDIAANRLATAEELGGTPITAGATLAEDVLRLTHGEGMPVVMEATGSVDAMQSTPDLVAAGGRIVIIGLVKKGVQVAFPGLDFTRKEMTIVGSRASVGCFPESLDLIARGAIRYPEIATAFALSDAPTVFTDIVDNRKPIHKAIFLQDGA
jgi:L-gulonate 5-dehydrogenase